MPRWRQGGVQNSTTLREVRINPKSYFKLQNEWTPLSHLVGPPANRRCHKPSSRVPFHIGCHEMLHWIHADQVWRVVKLQSTVHADRMEKKKSSYLLCIITWHTSERDSRSYEATKAVAMKAHDKLTWHLCVHTWESSVSRSQGPRWRYSWRQFCTSLNCNKFTTLCGLLCRPKWWTHSGLECILALSIKTDWF